MKRLYIKSDDKKTSDYIIINKKDLAKIKDITDVDEFKIKLCSILFSRPDQIILYSGVKKEKVEKILGVEVKELKINDEEINQQEEIESLLKSNDKKLNILGLYWKAKKFDIKTKEQLGQLILSPRNFAMAKQISCFSINDIIEKIVTVDKHAKKNEYTWGLSTLYKFLYK